MSRVLLPLLAWHRPSRATTRGICELDIRSSPILSKIVASHNRDKEILLICSDSFSNFHPVVGVCVREQNATVLIVRADLCRNEHWE